MSYSATPASTTSTESSSSDDTAKVPKSKGTEKTKATVKSKGTEKSKKAASAEEGATKGTAKSKGKGSAKGAGLTNAMYVRSSPLIAPDEDDVEKKEVLEAPNTLSVARAENGASANGMKGAIVAAALAGIACAFI